MIEKTENGGALTPVVQYEIPIPNTGTVVRVRVWRE